MVKKAQEGIVKTPEVDELENVAEIIEEEQDDIEDGKPGKDYYNIAGQDKKGNPMPPVWVKKGVEQYHLVMWSEKTNENETNDVILTVNGETLIFQRGKKVPVGDRYLECARHTKQPTYKQLPNVPRKVVGWIQTYVYHVLQSNVGKALFDQQKKEGDDAVRRYLEKQEDNSGEN